MRNKIVIFFVVVSILFWGCNACDCNKGTSVQGFYICSRTKVPDNEFIWILSSKIYVHAMLFDSVLYINSDEWWIDTPKDNVELFMGKNWVSPCKDDYSCFETIDKVTIDNFIDYMGSEAQLAFDCFNGLDNECHFRLMSSQEPMYNYKRLDNENHKLSTKGKKLRFYTKRDSVLYLNAVKNACIFTNE
jgi:hypothetical protein